jgi:hypothetical protein
METSLTDQYSLTLFRERQVTLNAYKPLDQSCATCHYFSKRYLKKRDKDENKNKKRCLLLSSTAAIVKTSKPVTTHHQNWLRRPTTSSISTCCISILIPVCYRNHTGTHHPTDADLRSGRHCFNFVWRWQRRWDQQRRQWTAAFTHVGGGFHACGRRINSAYDWYMNFN